MLTTERTTAERTTVSIPSDLKARMLAAGISPSEVLVAALRERLGDTQTKSLADQLDELRQLVNRQGRQLAKLAAAQKAK